MDITVWKCWMLFHVFLSLPGLGFMCSSAGSDTDSPMTDSPTTESPMTDSPTTGKCDIQLTHRCFITIRSINDTILSNYTIWACANGEDTSIRWSPDCCLDDNVIDAGTVLNLTTEETTKIECSPVSSNPPVTYMYKWRMDAPTQSKILLRVLHFDGSTINAKDKDNSGTTYSFPANSFATDGDSFLSSSYAVIMEAKLEESAQPSSFIVWGRALEVIDTINIANGTQECTLPSSIVDGNQWKSETLCSDGQYTFGDSCYQFSTNTRKQPGAKTNCEEMSGYHLVYIESSEEQAFLVSVTSSQAYWIGIRRNEEENRVWMDGSSVTNFNTVSDGLESQGQCVALLPRGNFTTWAKAGCGFTYRYICERERGYIGNNLSQGGCVTFKTVPHAHITNEGAILLKFGYYIKTYENATIVWTGNHIVECQPDNDQTLFQNGLQIKVSCGASLKSSSPWAVNFQAKGAGLVQLKEMQLIIYNGTQTTVPQQNSGQNEGTVVAIVMVLLVMLVVVLVAVAGFLWYKRRQRHAASANRKPQLQNQENHIHNPTYENSIDQGDRNEYADSIDPVLGSPNYVNHFVASGFDQQQGHPGAGSDFPRFPTNDNVVIEDGEHIYSGTLGDEGEDGYHEYSILERDLEKEPAEGNVSSGQDLSGYGRRPPPQRIVVNGVEYSLVDLEQRVQKPDTKRPHDVSRDGQGHPPRGIMVNNVKYTLVDLEQKAKRRDKSRPLEQRKDDSSVIGTTDDIPSPGDILQRGTKTSEESSASGYGSLEPVHEDVGNRSWNSKPKTPFQDPDQEYNDSYDHFQRRQVSGPPNHNHFANKQTFDDRRASGGVEEDADNTYQALDDGQEDQDNEEYSHLQRPLGNIPSPDEPRNPDSGNQYGELKDSGEY